MREFRPYPFVRAWPVMGASNARHVVDMDFPKQELLTWRTGTRPSAEFGAADGGRCATRHTA
jgi:hypothetical protein